MDEGDVRQIHPIFESLDTFAVVAQLVEFHPSKVAVVSSNLIYCSFWRNRSIGRVPVLKTGARKDVWVQVPLPPLRISLKFLRNREIFQKRLDFC